MGISKRVPTYNPTSNQSPPVINKPKNTSTKKSLSSKEQDILLSRFTDITRRITMSSLTELVGMAERNVKTFYPSFIKEAKTYERDNNPKCEIKVFRSFEEGRSYFESIGYPMGSYEKHITDFKHSNHPSVTAGFCLPKEQCVYNVACIFADAVIYTAITDIRHDIIAILNGETPIYDKADFFEMKDITDFIIATFKRDLYHECRHAEQYEYLRTRNQEYGSEEFCRYVMLRMKNIKEYYERPTEIDAFNVGDKQVNKFKTNKITHSYEFPDLFRPYLNDYIKKTPRELFNDTILRAYSQASQLLMNGTLKKGYKDIFANNYMRDMYRDNDRLFIGSHARIRLVPPRNENIYNV